MALQDDPVAAKSGFLRMYMSNHPDTLVSYAKWYAKVTGNITSAELTAIDSQVSVLCSLFPINQALISFLTSLENDFDVCVQRRVHQRGVDSV